MTARAAAFAMAVALAACGGGPPAPDESEDVATGPLFGTPRTSRPAQTEEPGTTGELEVLVRDADTKPRADVEIRYRGEGRSGTLFTDAGGLARARLPAGRYRVEIPGPCQEHYRMQRVQPSGGTVGIAVDQSIRVPFRIDATRRFRAAGPAEWSREPPWPRGEAVTFSFTLSDSCNDRPAPGVSFDTLEYAPSRHIRIVDAMPMRAGSDGRAEVTFTCVRAGDPHLYLRDPQNTRDRTDVLGLKTPFDPETELCG